MSNALKLTDFGASLSGHLLLVDALGSRFAELRIKACSVCGGDVQ